MNFRLQKLSFPEQVRLSRRLSQQNLVSLQCQNACVQNQSKHLIFTQQPCRHPSYSPPFRISIALPHAAPQAHDQPVACELARTASSNTTPPQTHKLHVATTPAITPAIQKERSHGRPHPQARERRSDSGGAAETGMLTVLDVV